MGRGLDGRDMLVQDGLPAGGALHDKVDRCLPLIEEAAEIDDEGEGQTCLNRLYTHPVERWRGSDLQVLSELVASVKSHDPGYEEDRKALQRYGLRVEFDGTGARPCLSARTPTSPSAPSMSPRTIAAVALPA